MERVIIGIDISKASFTAAVWNGEQVIDLGEWPNTPAGYEALGRQATSWQQHCAVEGIHVILEVTGGYELGLVAYAYTQS